MSILQVKNLNKYYRKGFWLKKTQVLHDVSFTIPSGTITGFLGSNGAGKTTSIKSILGLIHPSSAEITFFDKQILSSKVLAKIGYLPERPFFYDYLTGSEFLNFYANLSGIKKNTLIKERSEYVLKKVGLWHAKDKLLREYSKGMLQRIGIAQAIIHEPELLILDEPMSGLDPDGRYELAELIREIYQKGTSIFFSTHLLNDVETLCKYIVMMKSGRCIFEGSIHSLLDGLEESFSVSYLEKQNIQKVDVKDRHNLQTKIDELRKNNNEIIEIKNVKSNLEQAFMHLNK